MNLFSLLLFLPALVPQPETLPVVFRYFDQNAIYQAYRVLSANSTLDEELKKKLKLGLSTPKCKTGLLRVELNARLAQEWKRQLGLNDCPENCPSENCKKCEAFRKDLRAALYAASYKNIVCDSESETRVPKR